MLTQGNRCGRKVLGILFGLSHGRRSCGSWLGDFRCQGYTKTLAPSLLRSCTMSTSSSRSTGTGAGGERFDVPGDLGSMPKIQQQLIVLCRQFLHLASRFTEIERQRLEEAANAAAMQAAQKVEEERRKGEEVYEWNVFMYSLYEVQRAMEGRSATTAVGSTTDEKQEQGEAAGYVL